MDILVFGAGYVGLSTAAVLSKTHVVTVVELKEDIVKKINSGASPLNEKDLTNLLQRNVSENRLKAVSDLSSLIPVDIILICVNTPPLDDGSADLRQVQSVLDMIDTKLEELIKDRVVIGLRSTVPPGTTRSLLMERFSTRSESVGIVFSPEFLRQGTAVHDIQEPDRVVIGGLPQDVEVYEEMIKPCLVRQDTPFFRMTLESAEMCKYVSNCFLATKISFANEMAALAENIPEVDIDDVMTSVMADHRICQSHLRPGLGFGGSCFPKDISALLNYASSSHVRMNLLQSVLLVNDTTTDRLLSLVEKMAPDLKGKKVAILGITFKVGTDDTRGSPSLDLILKLSSMGAVIHAHDPEANIETVELEIRNKFSYTKDLETCTRQADIAFLMTDWPIYKDLGLRRIVEKMKKKIFIDGRRMFVNSDIPEDLVYKALGSF